ncbi:MAG TPA: sugar-binding protein [Abditibacteriaceae bacterium]|jgi:hypothetical protein
MNQSLLSRAALLCVFSGFGIGTAHAETVKKIAEPFESITWKVGDDSSANGILKTLPDVAPNIAALSKNALDIEAAYSGGGFEALKAVPSQPFVIPGNARTLSMWIRTTGGYGWVMQFKDGWGRSEANGRKLEWSLDTKGDGNWKELTFAVPADWVQPLRIDGVLSHNWGRQGEKACGHLQLDQLEIETDVSDVDATTGVLKTWRAPGTPADMKPTTGLLQKVPETPLLQATLSSTQMHNVFSGVAPEFKLDVQNWRAQPAVGSLQWKVVDADGKAVKNGTSNINVSDTASLPLPLGASRFGVYRLDSTIAWADGTKSTLSEPFAVIPVARELSEAEKDASPYGLNVLSARQPMVSTFRKAGVIWYRDYGFDFEWMTRAKGADKSYSGWPYYPKIAKLYQDNGVRVLANLKTALKPPAGNNAPDLNWTREMAGIMMAFPSIRTFELDNEYDLHAGNAPAEDKIGWKNYGNYHKKFGTIAQLLGDGQFTTVENGRAGIWPERLRKQVQSGDFGPIDVVNSHHYAGADAPEVNIINHNMGFSGDENVLSFFDQLRAAKAAGSADGKRREHWLTEFGWDTKAGPVVSPQHQAAYLARGFMMLAAAGTEKGFWFFDLDAAKSDTFFDGCGLFTFDQKPKLAYAAFAGMTQILPKPEYLGTINAGENTWGYLFRNEGKLVASLWTLDGKKGPRVDFAGAKLYDYLANPVTGSTVELGIEPVYAVGISPDSRWAKQAAYSLESPYLVTATSGDPITATIAVKNTRTSAIKGNATLQLPKGWTGDAAQTISATPGETVRVPLNLRIDPNEPLGEKFVGVSIGEGEALQTIPLRVQIQRPIVLSVRALQGAPGESDVAIRISNRSSRLINGALQWKLPTGWNAASPEIKVDALKPMEVRDITARVRWTDAWKTGESAFLEYRSVDGREAKQPLIAPRFQVFRAVNLTMDGDLKDWPARNKMPDWLLGSTEGLAEVGTYLAWSDKGLSVAVDVQNSKGSVPNPQLFWTGDVMELFVDTRDNKTARKTYEEGDHQFWFVPQFDTKRVYGGQWKRNEEIAATKFDLPGIQGAAVRKGEGYVMEFFVPASLLKNFNPAAGTKIGLNLNVSVQGQKVNREAFWPTPKSEGTGNPASWGTVMLAE